MKKNRLEELGKGQRRRLPLRWSDDIKRTARGAEQRQVESAWVSLHLARIQIGR